MSAGYQQLDTQLNPHSPDVITKSLSSKSEYAKIDK
jgi:hypothetical protein